MPKKLFTKGNKLSPGGKKGNKGGRPTKTKAEIKRLAAEMFRQYLVERAQPILDVYLALGGGTVVKVGRRKFKLNVDPATTRDFINKFVPDAPKTLNLDLTKTAEDYYKKVMEDAGVDITEEQRQIEPPEKEEMH